jgi:DNA-directed RNA polymerase specialized sigma24 family protein
VPGSDPGFEEYVVAPGSPAAHGVPADGVARGRGTSCRSREVTNDELRDEPSPGVDHDTRLALQHALMALPPRQRAVIVLRYFDDLTEKETARVLGVAVGTVKSQAREALPRLRTGSPGVLSLRD